MPLKRTNLIPATLQEKEKEIERKVEKERVKEREREREKVFPSLKDSDTSYRSVRATGGTGGGGGVGVKAGTGTGTEASSSTRKSRYFHLLVFIFFPSFFISYCISFLSQSFPFMCRIISQFFLIETAYTYSCISISIFK